MRVAPDIVLTDEERMELERLIRSKLTSVRLVQRARLVLLAAVLLDHERRRRVRMRNARPAVKPETAAVAS